MNGFLFFLFGVGMGVWSCVQSKALHLTPPNLPVIHHVDPVAVLLVAFVGLVAYSMRGKRNGGKP